MTFRLLLLVASVGLASAPARTLAQQAETTGADATPHVLEIRDGAVWLDGRELPDSSVPADLDLAGLQLSVEYSGPVTPVVEVDGVPYVLQGERLVPFEESSRAGAQVYFVGEAAPAPGPPPTLAGGAREEHEADDARLRRAGEAAYLRDLSATDRALYEQIRRESELEAYAQHLASEIRTMDDPAERAAAVDTLRSVLTEAFDLKQLIREAEIGRAEQQVGELRRMVHERRARRSMIVEHRLRELLGP